MKKHFALNKMLNQLATEMFFLSAKVLSGIRYPVSRIRGEAPSSKPKVLYADVLLQGLLVSSLCNPTFEKGVINFVSRI